MKWFRLYSEARNDAKLRALSAEQHRVWFNLLCYAAEQDERGCICSCDPELLAVECAEGNADLLTETLGRLTKLRIVTVEGGEVCFINFQKRQYDKPSAAPERVAERVSRHRDKVKQESNTPVTPGNAVATPEKRAYSDSEAEEYTETEKTPPKPPRGGVARDPMIGFDEFWTAYPRKEAREEAQKAWKRLKPDDDTREAILLGIARARENSDQWQRGIYPHPASWINGKRWNDEIAPPATSLTVRGRASPRLEPGQSANSAVANDIANHLRSLGAR